MSKKIYGTTVTTPFNPGKLGAVKTVNGISPDELGNVEIEVSGGNVDLDITLSVEGKAADAKAVGDATAVSAEYNEDTKTVSFKNVFGAEVFNLDLSSLAVGEAVRGELSVSVTDVALTEGASGTFTIALASAPNIKQIVYLATSDSTKVSVSPDSLTFDADNWDVPQTVTVTAMQDDDEDNEIVSITATSKNVEAKVVAITVTDDDKSYSIVTDGLVLNMDYTNHVGDESDTIVDLASGVSFKNFSQFEKQELGISSPSTTYKYLDVVANDEKTAFIDKVKTTGGFTLESFGTRLVPCFYLPNYKVVLDSGNAGGWSSTESVPVAAQTQVTRILQDDSTDQTRIGGSNWLYTLGEFTTPMNNMSIRDMFPYIEEFKHVVMTFSADGHVDCFVNGIKSDSPVSIENYKAWDFDTMFGGQWSLLNTVATTGVTTYHRIYNRVLTAEEVQQNMNANAMALGLTTF